jgi:Lipopolysaccharide-assembly
MRQLQFLCCLAFLPLFQHCYTFKGISIDPAVKTFAVRNLEISAENAPPTLGIDFAERLRDKIRNETRLSQNTETPDVEFSGQISRFNVIPLAPKPGEFVAKNQLVIAINLAYKNSLDEKKSWPNNKTFSFFADFENTADLLTVQDRLVKQISDQLLEDIFNAAFNDW